MKRFLYLVIMLFILFLSSCGFNKSIIAGQASEENFKPIFLEMKGYEILDSFQEDRAVVKKNGKFGFIDKNLKEVIPCVYQGANPFRLGYAIIKNENGYGTINYSGEIIVPIEYEELFLLSRKNEPIVFGAKKNGKYGLVNNKGKPITEFKYDEITPSADGWLTVRIGESHYYEKPDSGYPLYGLIDKKGNTVLKTDYNYIGDFINGLAVITQKNKYGFINLNLNIEVPIIYDVNVTADEELITYSFSDGIAVIKKGGLNGILNVYGKEIMLPEYDFISAFDRGLALVRKTTKQGDVKYGFIDKTGNEVIPAEYDGKIPANGDYHAFFDNIAAMQKGNSNVVINKRGKTIFTCDSEELIDVSNDKIYVGTTGKQKIYNITGEKAVLIPYEILIRYKDGYDVVGSNNKYGINKNFGQTITKLIYDEIGWDSNLTSKELFVEEYTRVKQNGKYGLIRKTGRLIIPVKYDEIDEPSCGMAKATYNGVKGYLKLTE